MKQTVSINRNKHEIDRSKVAINMKQTDSINRNKPIIDRLKSQ